eukprot:62903-Pyramimonas_sp.AAC.1
MPPAAPPAAQSWGVRRRRGSQLRGHSRSFRFQYADFLAALGARGLRVAARGLPAAPSRSLPGHSSWA